MLCTAAVRVCQHFSVKSVDQILMASLRNSMLLSSMECCLWISYPWPPRSEIKEWFPDSDFCAYYSCWNSVKRFVLKYLKKQRTFFSTHTSLPLKKKLFWIHTGFLGLIRWVLPGEKCQQDLFCNLKHSFICSIY